MENPRIFTTFSICAEFIKQKKKDKLADIQLIGEKNVFIRHAAMSGCFLTKSDMQLAIMEDELDFSIKEKFLFMCYSFRALSTKNLKNVFICCLQDHLSGTYLTANLNGKLYFSDEHTRINKPDLRHFHIHPVDNYVCLESFLLSGYFIKYDKIHGLHLKKCSELPGINDVEDINFLFDMFQTNF